MSHVAAAGFLGNVITLCVEKRGVQTNMVYHGKQVALTYEIPMAEVVLDFFDRLKSTSRGYASLDYNFKRFRASNMVRVDVRSTVSASMRWR